MADTTPADKPITIERMAAEQWREVRAFRLRALAEPGGVFGSSYEEQSKDSDAQWAERVEQLTHPTRAATWFARIGSEPVGMVGGVRDDKIVGRAWMISLWSVPEARRRGVGQLLAQTVIDWAKTDMACESLHLHCVDGNDTARKLYDKLGFTLTGDTIDHPRIEGLIEHEMRIAL